MTSLKYQVFNHLGVQKILMPGYSRPTESKSLGMGYGYDYFLRNFSGDFNVQPGW